MTKIKETSTNSVNRSFLTDCNLTYAVQIVFGRWKLIILTHLHKGQKRFSELKRTIPNITERMLTLQLRELEHDGLITRTVFAEVPPRVEYALTDIGIELIPICMQMNKWGAKHRLAHRNEISSVVE